jgi:sulfatase maturation enzyme AslB (radical SAM superfamily)
MRENARKIVLTESDLIENKVDEVGIINKKNFEEKQVMKTYTAHTTRKPLYQCLPLDTPFGVHICPTTGCNFKCIYCKQSSQEWKNGGAERNS